MWDGLRGQVGWIADFGRVTEHFTAPGLEISEPGGGVHLRNGGPQPPRPLRDQVADPAAFRRRFIEQVLVLLPDLLRRSPEIVLDRLSLRTAAGPVLLRGRVKFPASILPGPDAWKQLVGDAELHVPATILRAVLITQARSQLVAARGKGAVQGLDKAQIKRVATLMGRQRMQSLKARGLLECDGGECRTLLRYDSGRLTVNGRDLLRAPGAAR